MSIGLLGAAFLVVVCVYIIKIWFDYKKIAVQTKNYAKTSGIVYLFFAFTALTGFLYLPDSLWVLALSKLGIDGIEVQLITDFKWLAFAAFIVFAAAIVFILNKSAQATKNQKRGRNGVGNIGKVGGDVSVTQHYHEKTDYKWVAFAAFMVFVVAIFFILNRPAPTEALSNYFIGELERKDKDIDALQQQLDKRLPTDDQLRLSAKINQLQVDKQDFEQKAKELEQRLESYSQDIATVKQVKLRLNDEGIDSALSYLESINFDKALEQAVENAKILLIQADLYALKHQHQKANDTYLKSIRFHRSFDSTMTYSNYLYDQNEFEASIKQLSILRIEREKLTTQQTASIAVSLGNAYQRNNRSEDAKRSYDEALKIYRALSKQNPGAYQPDVAMTLNNLAVLYRSDNRLTEAEKAYDEALKIYRALSKQNPGAYGIYYANTLLMGVDLLNKGADNLDETRKILQQFKGIPKADRLLSMIEKLEK